MPIYMGVFTKPGELDKHFRGGVNASGYEGWIELHNAQYGSARNINSNSSGSTNRDRSQPTSKDISVTKSVDAVSAAIFNEALKGKGRLVVLAYVDNAGKTFQTLVMQDAMISSYNTSSGGDTAMESFSLHFTKITYEMSPKSPNADWQWYDSAIKGQSP